jgi:hypothetical protein
MLSLWWRCGEQWRELVAPKSHKHWHLTYLGFEQHKQGGPRTIRDLPGHALKVYSNFSQSPKNLSTRSRNKSRGLVISRGYCQSNAGQDPVRVFVCVRRVVLEIGRGLIIQTPGAMRRSATAGSDDALSIADISGRPPAVQIS